MERIQVTTLAAQDISSALLVATYTADADRELLVQLYMSGLAGNGSYRACVTKQLLGAGSVYQGGTTVIALSPTVTTVFMPTIAIPVQDTDVLKVYAQGLAGDNSVAVVTEVFDTMSTLTSCLTAGAIEYTYTVTSSATGNPVANISIWVSTDLAGTNVIWAGQTDAFGVARDSCTNKPMLNAGTYYFWKNKVGYTIDNYPDTEVVS